MSLTKSISSTAQASAAGVAFKQLNLETAPAQRPEKIAVIGQAATSKDGIYTADVPVLSDGTLEQAFALYGPSPLYYAAEKLFPRNGKGAQCPVYFVPISAGGTPAHVVEAYDLAGTATRTFDAFLAYKELPVSAAADAVGKIATNALNNPARAPRKIALDGFSYAGLKVSIQKGDTAKDVADKLSAAATDSIFYAVTVGSGGSGTAATLTISPYFQGDYDFSGMRLLLSDGADVSTSNDGLSLAYNSRTISGAGTFDVSDALDNLTEDYGITRIVNQFDDDTNLDLIQAWGEGKRDSLIGQYAISYFGREYDESGVVAGTVDVAAIATFGDGRRDDAVNSAIYGTYGDLRELTYTQRDTLLKAGISNIEVRNGIRYLMDSVTFYHPEGTLNPIFAYDDSITKEGNIAYDLLTYFNSDEWASKIIVSVDSKTTNPDAIDINGFAAAVNGRAELWEKTALIASAKFVKDNSTFEIDGTNPRRLNANVKAQLTSTASIIDNTLYLGFLFGETA